MPSARHRAAARLLLAASFAPVLSACQSSAADSSRETTARPSALTMAPVADRCTSVVLTMLTDDLQQIARGISGSQEPARTALVAEFGDGSVVVARVDAVVQDVLTNAAQDFLGRFRRDPVAQLRVYRPRIVKGCASAS